MKILFMDDNKYRLQQLKSAMTVCADFVYAMTSYAAIEAMEKNDFDVLLLDHDLNLEHDHPTEDGRAVARWITEHPDRVKDARIIIHSYNAEGAYEMYAIITKSFNEKFSEGVLDSYAVSVVSFDPYTLAGILKAHRQQLKG
jgi:CheY-like chemotaxis protein